MLIFKKIFLTSLAAVFAIGAIGCSNKTPNSTSTASPEKTPEPIEQTTKAPDLESEFTLYYPEFMHTEEGESMTLDKAPERIVCLSNTALQVLVRANIRPVAVTSLSKNGSFPDWVKELPQIEVGMNGLDLEAVVSLEPDLVMVGGYQKAEYGKQLADAGINVYYTTEGPSVTYGETRDGSIAIAKSFGSEELVESIESEFAAVEQRCAEFTAANETKTMMIFFSKPGEYQQTSEGYLGSMLKMLPFENLSDKLVDPSLRTAPIDIETCIEQNPDIIFGIIPGVPTGDMVRSTYEEVFNADRALWDRMDAVKNDNIVYLGTEYISTKGLQVIDSINKLIDMLEAAGDNSSKALGTRITYPENMKKLGYTEPVELEKMPQRVVCMSTTPVLALNRLGVNMIAVPKSAVVQWPENMKDVELLQLSHNENFDIETVVAMEPDLVILGYTSQDTYGKVLESVNIPVYYVDAGHTVSYDSIKQQTEVLIEAFAGDGTEGAQIMKLFTDLEARLTETKKAFEGKTVMVLQSSPPSHYIQTKGGTLGSMAEMIGLTNVYENDASFMAPIDFETALELEPDLVLAVGMSPFSEGHRQVMEEDYKNNPDYWNSIRAIAEGDIIYLPVNYISSAGINVVDHIGALADLITEHFAE